MIWVQVAWFIVTLIASIALAPKPPKPRSASIEDFDLPTAEEGRPIPVVFGTMRVAGPNVLWYGDLGKKAIKKSSMFSSQVIGYQYFLGLHFGVCHGPIDALTKVEVGEKEAWTGSVTANGSFDIVKPSLFGGKKGEGGLNGTLNCNLGGAAQGVDSYLLAKLGTPLPAFRGVTAFVWHNTLVNAVLTGKTGGYVGNTSYPKPWAFHVRRILKGWENDTVWYSAKAAIGTSMNPAHILYQSLTDPEWGMGLPETSLDSTGTWEDAADQFHAEGFGLDLIWNQQTAIEEFVQTVLDHVGGLLRMNHHTGKLELRLIRDDYDAGTLATFNEDNIRAIKRYQRQAWGETVNEVTLLYTDAATRKTTGITVQDLGNIRSQTQRIAETVDYPGITSATIAQKTAARELAARSTPLATITFEVDRTFWAYTPGDVVKISWASLGINSVVFRVIKAKGGTLTDSVIEVEAVEDIFGLPSASYAAVPSPPGDPADATDDPEVGSGGGSVISTVTTAPPGSPADGDRYFVPTGATGAWAGHEGQIAIWNAETGEWDYELPDPGTVVYDTGSSSHVDVGAGTGAVGPAPWPSSALTFLTTVDETTPLPNSRRLVAGPNVSFNTGTAGQLEISASGGGGGSGGGDASIPTFVRATTADQSVASSTTLVDATGLTVDLEAGKSYVIEFHLRHQISAAGDFNGDFNYTGTVTDFKASYHRWNTNGEVGGTFRQDLNALNTVFTWTVASLVDGVANFVVSITTNTAGTLSLRFAQNTSDATPAKVQRGSYIRAQEAPGSWGAGTVSGCIVTRAALQTFNTTAAAVSWDTEVLDTEGYFSSLNPTRIVIPASGWYTVIGTVNQNTDADDAQVLAWRKNGAAEVNTQHKSRIGISTAIVSYTQVADVDYYVAGDYLELYVANRTGSSTCYARASIVRNTGPTGPKGDKGDIGSAIAERVAYQLADLVVTNNATYQDTDLKLTLQPGTYYVEAETWLRSHATPGALARMNFTGTAAWAIVKRFGGQDGTTIGQAVGLSLPNATNNQNFTDEAAHRWCLALNVTVAGDLSIQFRQNTSNANAVTFRRGSVMRVKDISGTANIDAEIAADAPRAYWKMDEASGNLADSSGNGYTLTAVGTPIAAGDYRFANITAALPNRGSPFINGVSSSNRFDPSSALLGMTAPVTTITIETWGRWTGAGFIGSIGGAGETLATNYAIQFEINSNGTVGILWERGAGVNVTQNSRLGGLLDGALHHICWVKDATARTSAVYIDGQHAGTYAYTAGDEHNGGTSTAFAFPMIAGATGNSAVGIFGGYAVYNTALSLARVQAHAKALGVFK